MSRILTLVTSDGVYAVAGAARTETLTTELPALAYAARHLRHEQWSQILRAERLAGGAAVVVLPEVERAWGSEEPRDR